MFYADQDDYIYWLEQLAGGILGLAGYQSTSFTAANGFIYPINADVTVTLPLAVITGSRIVLVRATADGTQDYSRISINPNGNILDLSFGTQTFVLYDRIELLAVAGAWVSVSDFREGRYNRDNLIMNGAFDISQRATSFALTTSKQYTLDRWYAVQSTTAQSTISKATSLLSGFQNAMKVLLTGTSTGAVGWGQVMESVDATKFAGRRVTITIRAIRGSTWNPAHVSVQLISGTGTDQGSASLLAGTWSGTLFALNSSFIPTTAEAIYRFRADISVTCTELALHMTATPTGAAVDANSFLQITGISIKEDPSDHYPAKPISAVLLDCQRYYEKSYPQGTAVPTNLVQGLELERTEATVASTNVVHQIKFKVTKRIAPTVVVYSYTSSTTSKISNGSGTDLAASSGVPQNATDGSVQVVNSSGGALTPAGGGFVFHWAADAEL